MKLLTLEETSALDILQGSKSFEVLEYLTLLFTHQVHYLLSQGSVNLYFQILHHN